MAELRIRIPEDLKRKMEKFGIDRSPIIRRMIESEIRNLAKIEEIISKSRMTEEGALRLGKKMNKLVAERFRMHVTGNRR